jgi:hypothetical protein
MDNNEYLRSVARIRDSRFKEETLGTLGEFYTNTAKAYREKAASSKEQLDKLQGIWEDRFSRAEAEYFNAYKSRLLSQYKNKNIDILRLRRDPSIMDYDLINNATTLEELQKARNAESFRPDLKELQVQAYAQEGLVPGKKIRVQGILDETGKRRSYEDILKMDTSRQGNVFLSGQEALAYLNEKANYDDYSSSYTKYETQFEQEQAALTKRNEEAKAKFLAEKDQLLMQAQSSAYRGATYQEKPL